MGLFSRNWNKPGKGVDPNEPQKRSFFRFFDIFFRKFWHFVKLNLIYAIALIPTFIIVGLLAGFVSGHVLSLPGLMDSINSMANEMVASGGAEALTFEAYQAQTVVLIDLFIRLIVAVLFVLILGMGPATAGLAYVLRNFAREEHAWIWSDFKDAAKSNFKQASIVFLIDVVVYSLLFISISFYGQIGGWMAMLKYPLIIVAIIFAFMHFYIYQMMVTFKLSIKNLYKNALIFALGKLPSNVLTLFLILFVNLGLAYLCIVLGGAYSIMLLLALLLLEATILLSFSGFIISFSTYPKIKKYMLLDTTTEVKPDKRSIV
ncbi:MAG: DUF624 domain-containing protein [Oscillospiraceae bacterium]